ncbi:MAG: aminopeptidase P family protein [Ignavibacteria bacterium]|nr:aminopeptidase P family protein [Ignavibacteria bacterium]
MNSRLEKLRAQFDSLKIDAFLVTFPPHLRYLSNFSGSSGVGLVTAHTSYLMTDGRYASQVRDEVNDWKVIITQKSFLEEFHRRKLLRDGARVGFDGNTMVFTQVRDLRKMFSKVKFLPKVECVEKIAVVKDEKEISRIKRAVAITDTVFLEILPLIKPGVREQEIAAEISYLQRKHGAEADAFETIVASGERSALPHGRASSKKFQRGELITLDFGCVYEGYHSDMTRTVHLGKPTSEAKKIYSVVLEAQQRAVAAATAGMKTSDLDRVARGYIKKQGYDKFYRHSLGHGIGLQIHEPPRVSVLSTARLETGNVFTIEPGVYIPGFGGVRIEDDVVIHNSQCEVLNRSPKELMIL